MLCPFALRGHEFHMNDLVTCLQLLQCLAEQGVFGWEFTLLKVCLKSLPSLPMSLKRK